MPSPKKCKAKFPVGSKAYDDCVNYKGASTPKNTKKSKKPSQGMGY